MTRRCHGTTPPVCDAHAAARLTLPPRSYYCDFCDAYLTHDSARSRAASRATGVAALAAHSQAPAPVPQASVRKQHNTGFKHKARAPAPLPPPRRAVAAVAEALPLAPGQANVRNYYQQFDAQNLLQAPPPFVPMPMMQARPSLTHGRGGAPLRRSPPSHVPAITLTLNNTAPFRRAFRTATRRTATRAGPGVTRCRRSRRGCR